MKKFKLLKEDIIRLTPNLGACLATDKITVEGLQIGFMYREVPQFDVDSGWRFFSGTETQAYVDDSKNIEIYDLNTIANYDRSIIPYLNLPIGTALEKTAYSESFKLIDNYFK